MGMRELDLEERVFEVMKEIFGERADRVNRDTTILVDLGADSLDVAELVMELEEEFDINIPDTDTGNEDKTVGQVIDYIAKRIAG